MLPPGDLDRWALLVLDHLLPRWLTMSGRIIGLQLVPILARGPALAGRCGSSAIQAPVELQADQAAFDGQPAQLTPHPGGVVGAIQSGDDRGRTGTGPGPSPGPGRPARPSFRCSPAAHRAQTSSWTAVLARRPGSKSAIPR